MFGFDKENKCLHFNDSYFIHNIADESEIDGFELEEEIILRFNGYVSACGDMLEYAVLQFDNYEDGEECAEYLNGLLVLNKLMGE